MKSRAVRAAVVVAAVGMTACGMPAATGPVVKEHHEVERGAATAATVDIDMSAGDLDVRSGASKLFEADFAFNAPVLKPKIQYAVAGGTGTLRVSQASASRNSENNWQLRIDDKTPVDLDLTLGAGDTTILLPASVGVAASTSGLIGDSNWRSQDKSRMRIGPEPRKICVPGSVAHRGEDAPPSWSSRMRGPNWTGLTETGPR